MDKFIIKVLLIIFAIRPIIDLAYEKNIILGLNLAGIIALFCIFMMLMYATITRKFLISISLLVFIPYASTITIINATTFNDFADLIRMISSLAFLLVVAPTVDEKTLLKYLKIYILITLIPIFLTYLQVAGLADYKYWDWVDGVHVARATGSYSQPSVLTRFLVFGILYSLYFIYSGKINSFKSKCILWIYILLNIISVFFSYHRTGYFLIALIIGLWLWEEYRSNMMKLIINIIPIILIIIVLFAALYKNGFIYT
jgi:hypothetical protein